MDIINHYEAVSGGRCHTQRHTYCTWDPCDESPPDSTVAIIINQRGFSPSKCQYVSSQIILIHLNYTQHPHKIHHVSWWNMWNHQTFDAFARQMPGDPAEFPNRIYPGEAWCMSSASTAVAATCELFHGLNIPSTTAAPKKKGHCGSQISPLNSRWRWCSNLFSLW